MDGGREANGTPLYIARVRYSDGVHTAKAGEHLPGAQLAFSGTEVVVNVRTNPTTCSVQRRDAFTDTPGLPTGLRSVVP